MDNAFELFINAKWAEKIRDRTLADYRSYWRYFREWLTATRPEINSVKQITTDVVRAYTGYMTHEREKYAEDKYREKTGKNLSTATVASRLQAVKAICKFWTAEGLLGTDPAAKIKAPRGDAPDKTLFTDEQFAALIDAPDTDTFAGFRDRTLMVLLADTGLRITEALSLEDGHFDFSARCIRLPAHLNKNRKPRVIPVSASVLRDVLQLIEENRSYFDTNHVFISNYGEPLKADHFRKQLKRYAAQAGIDTKEIPITPHRFRDYFCTNYLLNGGDLYTLQRIVAHADI